ncbi:MAG: ABC transporter substrate-binding protein [Ktedonobacteraceae bacterium]
MQDTSKLIMKLLLIFVYLMMLTACSSEGVSKTATNFPTPPVSGTPKASYEQQVYHSYIGQDDVTTLDPALVGDAASRQAIDMVFNGLVQMDDNLQVQPELAQSWQQSSDGLLWTFHLRSHLTFSDGTLLTSKDVAYSIDRALQPTTKSAVSFYYLKLIQDADKLSSGQISTLIGDSILTPDAETIIFKLNKKSAYFLYTLTYPCSYVIEKSMIDKYGNEHFTDHLSEGGGAGPFIVSQYLHKQQINFAPNAYYYNFKPLLREVVFFFMKASNDVYQAYLDGKIDVSSVPPDRVDEARRPPNQYLVIPNLFTIYFAMNFLAKPFDNLYIRQAFALSINREILNNTVYGAKLIPTYHIIPQGMAGYNLNLVGPANVKNTRGDITHASQLLQVGLQQEGWADVSQIPPIKITYIKGTKSDELITLAIQMWQSALGVSITPDPVDTKTFLKEENATKNNNQGLQIWLYSWSADYPDAQNWTTLQFGKGAVGNYMNYGQNTTADALQEQTVQQQLEHADLEADAAARLLLYQSAEQQLINQVAWMPLLQATSTIVQKPYVKGIAHNGLGLIPPSDWANIYISEH